MTAAAAHVPADAADGWMYGWTDRRTLVNNHCSRHYSVKLNDDIRNDAASSVAADEIWKI